ncbi:hypothetical protein JHK87_049764 [Glycine soja]|nr:hypothetical protein JHK87_049764 [Glycine soja]
MEDGLIKGSVLVHPTTRVLSVSVSPHNPMFVPVTHIQVSNPGNQIELSGRKLVIDSR